MHFMGNHILILECRGFISLRWTHRRLRWNLKRKEQKSKASKRTPPCYSLLMPFLLELATARSSAVQGCCILHLHPVFPRLHSPLCYKDGNISPTPNFSFSRSNLILHSFTFVPLFVHSLRVNLPTPSNHWRRSCFHGDPRYCWSGRSSAKYFVHQVNYLAIIYI
jgi:hypothetical protein